MQARPTKFIVPATVTVERTLNWDVSVVPEARIEDGVPQTAGWFVVNARGTRWLHNELGSYCGFEGKALPVRRGCREARRGRGARDDVR